MRKIGWALAYAVPAIVTSPAACHFASCSYRDYDVPMPRRMTIAGQIEQLIGNLGGSPICDDCITDQLNLSVRSQTNVVTRELGHRDEYDRAKTSCGQCGALKTAIQIRK
ncbi:hypothetical protein [Sphingopyxis sp. 22461]|uniref:hypothetical protein n=1 Tax=Sphingopyxis sp. 22461 TaxID=3453923 RepID=UPI003F843A9A